MTTLQIVSIVELGFFRVKCILGNATLLFYYMKDDTGEMDTINNWKKSIMS